MKRFLPLLLLAASAGCAAPSRATRAVRMRCSWLPSFTSQTAVYERDEEPDDTVVFTLMGNNYDDAMPVRIEVTEVR